MRKARELKIRILPKLIPVFTALMLVGGLTQCTGKTAPTSSTPGTSVPAPSDQADAIVYVEGMT